MSPLPDLPLSPLDESLAETLRPLVQVEAKVEVPFFANTFPLAFHYWCSWRLAGRAGVVPVRFIDWTEPWFRSASKLTVGYVSESNATEMPRTPVTTYLPRWVFAEFSPAAVALRGKSDKFRDIVGLLVGQRRVEVYSDIPEQAKSVCESILEGRTFSLMEPDCPGIFDVPQTVDRTVRLFMYGGPLSTYFLRKHKWYVPFALDSPADMAASVAGKFKTLAALARTEGHETEVLTKTLASYHQQLYSAAKDTGEHWQLRSAQEFYNRASIVRQHRSSFLSPEEFARCLSDHHQLPTARTDP
ncbi:MAG: hypothetical protein AMXMBFR57_07130 [Acidimicrobiia bacterium]